MNPIDTLTPAQHAVLAYAIEHSGGKIDWFPNHISGGARKKVLDGLANRCLVAPEGSGWVVAAPGYAALGLAHKGPTLAPDTLTAPSVANPVLEASLGASVACSAPTDDASPHRPHSRANSKQAAVLEMLRRPEGATVQQICEATGWLAHTVRGTFAGAFKHKMGLAITSAKPQGGVRVYRLA